jgi:uncharacterized protein
VWLAPLPDGRAGFTTDADSGKIKRLRNNPAVTLQACTMRGAIIEGSPIVEATAEAVSGDEYDEVHAAIRSKYGLMVTLIGIPQKIVALFGKKTANCAVVVTLPEP